MIAVLLAVLYAAQPTESFKAAINAAAIGQGASDAKKAQEAAKVAAQEAVDLRLTLEQWQAAQAAILAASAKKAEDAQQVNQQYAFWGIVLNVFGVIILGALAKFWSSFRAELRLLPEVIHQLSLIGPAIKELVVHTNSQMDKLVVATAAKSHAEGVLEGKAEAAEEKNK